MLVYSFKYYGVYLGFFLLVTNFSYFSEHEFFNPIELNTYSFWDDYYEALFNSIMNDLFGLNISYYIVSNFEFLLIGVLLLFGSVVCVNLNRINRNSKSNNYYDLLTLFDFFKDFVKFFFMRKQNLVDQEIHLSATRFFKKKSIIFFEKLEKERKEKNKIKAQAAVKAAAKASSLKAKV